MPSKRVAASPLQEAPVSKKERREAPAISELQTKIDRIAQAIDLYPFDDFKNERKILHLLVQNCFNDPQEKRSKWVAVFCTFVEEALKTFQSVLKEKREAAYRMVTEGEITEKALHDKLILLDNAIQESKEAISVCEGELEVVANDADVKTELLKNFRAESDKELAPLRVAEKKLEEALSNVEHIQLLREGKEFPEAELRSKGTRVCQMLHELGAKSQLIIEAPRVVVHQRKDVNSFCDEDDASAENLSREVEKVFANHATEQQNLVNELKKKNHDLFVRVKDVEEAMKEASLKQEKKKTDFGELKETLSAQQAERTTTQRLQKDEKDKYEKNLDRLSLANERANKIEEIVKLCEELHGRTENLTESQKMLVVEADAISSSTASMDMEETAPLTSKSMEATTGMEEAFISNEV